MALYHFHVDQIKRSSGQSAIAAAAGVVPNILQGTAGIAGALVLMPVLRKTLHFRAAAKS